MALSGSSVDYKAHSAVIFHKCGGKESFLWRSHVFQRSVCPSVSFSRTANGKIKAEVFLGEASIKRVRSSVGKSFKSC